MPSRSDIGRLRSELSYAIEQLDGRPERKVEAEGLRQNLDTLARALKGTVDQRAQRSILEQAQSFIYKFENDGFIFDDEAP